MLRLVSSQRAIGIALAVVVAAGIGWAAYALGSSAGARSEAPLVAAATGPAVPDLPGPPSSASSSSPSSPSSASSPSAQPLTLAQAETVALRAAGGGRVVEASEDAEPTGLEFDITVLHPNGSETKVDVDAATGRVLRIEQDTDRD